jgi:DNA-binding YbaB/EbfC family protein
MFGNLMGQMQEQQKAMRAALEKITVEAAAGDGAVKVQANANRQILNISIDKNLLDGRDIEQLEGLITVAVNRALEMAAQEESEAAQQMVKSMLPAGLGNLLG